MRGFMVVIAFLVIVSGFVALSCDKVSNQFGCDVAFVDKDTHSIGIGFSYKKKLYVKIIGSENIGKSADESLKHALDAPQEKS